MPINPLLLGLLGATGIFIASICLVLAALCRKHYGKHCHRTDGATKHVPMEAVIAADDLIIDGSVTGIRSPATPDTALTESIRNGTSIEDTDPDIIRNQYGNKNHFNYESTINANFILERRTGLGFTKVYQPPGSREEEDNDEEHEYNFKHVAKEAHLPNQTVSL